jgi:hypothetical protein
MTKSEFEEKPLSLKIESKFTYWMLIISITMMIFFVFNFIYLSWTNSNYGFLCFFSLLSIALFYYLFHTTVKTDFTLELHEKKLLIKRPFNRNLSIRYDQISEINISYNKIPTHLRTTPREYIVIGRKFNKPISINIKLGRILDFREESNFSKCLYFLSTKTPVILHIHTMYKKAFVENKIRTNAKLEWSDSPNIFHKMK